MDNESLKTDQLFENTQEPIVTGEIDVDFGDVTEDAVETCDDAISESLELLVEANNAESIVSNFNEDPGNEAPTEEAQEEKPAPIELSESEKLIQKRTGYWPVNLDSIDLKWIKNACNTKFEFTGPNEAYMLMNCFIGFSSAIEREKSESGKNIPSILPAAAIEACAFFMNRYSGSGLDSAQRSFRIAMVLNPVIMEMRSLDEQIEAARKNEAAKKADLNGALKIQPTS